MSGETNFDQATLKAVSQIKEVKFARSEKTGKYYLVIFFKDPAWMSYIRTELFFRIITKQGKVLKMKKISDVPTDLKANALIILLEDEFKGVVPDKIRIFDIPPDQDDYIREIQIQVQDIT